MIGVLLVIHWHNPAKKLRTHMARRVEGSEFADAAWALGPGFDLIGGEDDTWSSEGDMALSGQEHGRRGNRLHPPYVSWYPR
ncbi:protein of unknown function [Denitratisoma oestradiolicum]|uniref:Uncharacterized protein n=1 Tax=Denitratisoma oestradiolicum TaxID=311182 RepID=A0A6S6XZW3_9PROT|nr:protein of unknown function [Denitratisoma oestradiolicum]